METTDLMFSAWLRFKGFELSDFQIINRGKGKFIFDINEKDWKSLKLEFINSETGKIKQTIEQLKDLIH